MAQLQQENMILFAEKQSLQSELTFYKNELAKLCLYHNQPFPVFRHFKHPREDKQHSSFSSDAANTSKITNINSQSQIIVSELATPSMIVSPNMFYHHKNTSESRYLNLSHQGIEDQASTTLSHLRQSKDSQVLKASYEMPSIIRHDREVTPLAPDEVSNIVSKDKQSSELVESFETNPAKCKGVSPYSSGPFEHKNSEVHDKEVNDTTNNGDMEDANIEFAKEEDRKRMFEDELEKLRLQLATFNEEEKRVMLELQEPRSFRKILQASSVQDHSQCSVESSFHLPPQRLNFDGCSQRSNQLLSSPILNPSATSGFKMTQLDINATHETSSQQLTTQQDVQSEEEGSANDALDSVLATTAEIQAHASAQAQSTETRQLEGIPEEAEAAGAQETITIEEQSDETQQPSFVNRESLEQHALDFIQGDPFVLKQKQIPALQFSQIIEEEHESESAATSSVNHSRNVSSILIHAANNNSQIRVQTYPSSEADLGNITKQPSGTMKSSIHTSLEREILLHDENFIKEIGLFNEISDESLQVLHQEKISPKNETAKDVTVNLDLLNFQNEGAKAKLSLSGHVMGQSLTGPHQTINNSVMSSKGSTPGNGVECTENTLKKFERLIQETQRSDEISLLRHIQRNLEHIQSAGSQESRFAQLQQQQSPSPVKPTVQQFKFQYMNNQKAAKLVESTCGDSVDSKNLIAEFNFQEKQQNAQSRNESNCTQVTGQQNTGAMVANSLGLQTQMSETTQFLAAAGQTGTTIPIVSNRSSDQIPATDSDEQASNQTQGLDMKTKNLQKFKSRNALPTQQSSGNNQLQAGRSVNSMQVFGGEPSIKILQNPAAADTMTTGTGKNPLDVDSSIEALSKATPFFHEPTSFEQTKRFNRVESLRQSKGTLESHDYGPQLGEKIDAISFCQQSSLNGRKGAFLFNSAAYRTHNTDKLDSENTVTNEAKIKNSQILASTTSPDTQNHDSTELFRHLFTDIPLQPRYNVKQVAQKDESDQTGPEIKARAISVRSSSQNQTNAPFSSRLAIQYTAPSPAARSNELIVQALPNNFASNIYASSDEYQSLSKVDQKDQKAYPLIVERIPSSQSNPSSRTTTPLSMNRKSEEVPLIQMLVAKNPAQSNQHSKDQKFVTSSVDAVSRSSFNIYKRNTAKMAQKEVSHTDIIISETPDELQNFSTPHQAVGSTSQTKRMLIQYNNMKRIEEDTRFLQAPSQTTLNLDQQSPFQMQEQQPLSLMARLAARSEEALQKIDSTKNARATQSQEAQDYQDCYEDYIQGSVTPSDVPHRSQTRVDIITVSGDQESTPQPAQSNLRKNKSASMLGINLSNNSLNNTQNKYLRLQNQSRVSPCPGSYKRNKEAQTANTSRSMYNNSQHTATSNSSRSRLVSSTPSQAVYTTFNTRKNSQQNQGGHARSQRNLGSSQSSSRTSNKVFKTESAATNEAQENIAAAYTEAASQQQQQVRSATPGYMQPIGSKFKRQTIEMMKLESMKGRPQPRFVIQPTANTVKEKAHLSDQNQILVKSTIQSSQLAKSFNSSNKQRPAPWKSSSVTKLN